MALITGTVSDIGMQPLSGDLSVSSVEFRSEGDVLVAPEIRSFPIVAGVVNAELLTGPCRVTIRVGSHARRSFDVVVPDVPSVTLADLVESAIVYEPPVVSAVAGHRAAAEAAADRAEDAAGDVDAAIAGAADQVVAAVEADRVAAEQAASDAAGSASSASGSASAAAGSESAAATSAAVAGTQATLAGERAGDAGVARDAASGSATAAAGSASAAASSASDAAGSATDADAARAAAVVARTGAETARTGAEGARDAADGHATRAETAADSFDLTATATTGAAGSNAAVTVTGDGPAYGLSFTVPRGDKGDKGDKGDRGDDGEVSQAALDSALSGKADLVGGKVPESQLPAIGGSTDASLLTGALTGQVDASEATVPFNPGLGAETVIMGLSTAVNNAAYLGNVAYNSLLNEVNPSLQYLFEHKSDVSHTHDGADITGALTGQVDASAAEVEFLDPLDDQPVTGPLSVILRNHHSVVASFPSFSDAVGQAIDAKSDVGHTHPVTDLTAAGTRSTSTFLRGDGTWSTPPNTTYSVGTQAEAEAGTANTARAFSALRVRQAADAAITARIQLVSSFPSSPVSGVLYLKAE